MLAAIMCGQTYFALTTENAFEYRIDLDNDIDTAATSADLTGSHALAEASRANAGTEEKLPARERMLQRLKVALVPPLVLFIGVIFCVILWMLATRQCWKLRDIIAVVITGVAFVLLTVIALMVTQTFPSPKIWFAFLGVSAFFAIVLFIAGARSARAHDAGASDSIFWRNQIVGFQTKLLQWSVLSAIVLLFAGFGHEVIDFLLFTDAARDWIAERGYDVKMGARPMARVIQEHIRRPLAEELKAVEARHCTAEGAAEGAGLGHEFLAHVERCRLLVQSSVGYDRIDVPAATAILVSDSGCASRIFTRKSVEAHPIRYWRGAAEWRMRSSTRRPEKPYSIAADPWLATRSVWWVVGYGSGTRCSQRYRWKFRPAPFISTASPLGKPGSGDDTTSRPSVLSEAVTTSCTTSVWSCGSCGAPSRR